MTEEDVKRIIAEHAFSPRHEQRGLDPQTVQWLVRSAFEEAWRAAGGDPALSHHDATPIGWRLAWMQSNAREVLRRHGMISGQDTYK